MEPRLQNKAGIWAAACMKSDHARANLSYLIDVFILRNCSMDDQRDVEGRHLRESRAWKDKNF